LHVSKFRFGFVGKGEQPYRGKPWEINKGGKPPNVKPHQGMTPPNIDANVKKIDAFFYYGKSRHHSRDCLKENFDEFKCRNRRHIDQFVDIGETMKDEFQNIILYISNLSFSA